VFSAGGSLIIISVCSLCHLLCKLTSLRNLNLNGNKMCTNDDICEEVRWYTQLNQLFIFLAGFT